jgi:hypothetical protein
MRGLLYAGGGGDATGWRVCCAVFDMAGIPPSAWCLAAGPTSQITGRKV